VNEEKGKRDGREADRLHTYGRLEKWEPAEKTVVQRPKRGLEAATAVLGEGGVREEDVGSTEQ